VFNLDYLNFLLSALNSTRILVDHVYSKAHTYTVFTILAPSISTLVMASATIGERFRVVEMPKQASISPKA
jgi:hypothetical protein